MPVVNSQRVKSQIKVLESHIENIELFIPALHSILSMYSSEKNKKARLFSLNKYPAYQIPGIVFSEIDSFFKRLAINHPANAITIARQLWEDRYLEPKKFAITLITNINPDYYSTSIDLLSSWVDDDINKELFAEMISTMTTRTKLVEEDDLLNLISTWLNSNSRDMQKHGLLALGFVASHKEFQNIPRIFSLITPLFSQPDLLLQKDLIAFIKTLINRTQPETASFLIMLLEIYPNKNVYAFVRKCVPFFDEYFQEELRKVLHR